jgi:hypothetical protein
MWREVNCGERKATAADIGLKVPHTIVTAPRRQAERNFLGGWR